MAKAPDKQEKPVAEAAPAKSKKLVLLLIIGLVLILILGGGTAFLLLKKSKAAAEDGEVEAKHDVKPVFVKLESFTVKLQPDEGKQEQQFMQTVPELKVRDALIAEKAKTYMPEIRHNILLLLSSRRPSELATPQGMEKLSADIRGVTNKILGDGAKRPADKGRESADKGKVDPDDAVQAVLFSTFIVQ